MKNDANVSHSAVGPRPMAPENFYAVNADVFMQTLQETKVGYELDMGAGVVIYHGTRYRSPIWLMENPAGCLHGVWFDESLPN